MGDKLDELLKNYSRNTLTKLELADALTVISKNITQDVMDLINSQVFVNDHYCVETLNLKLLSVKHVYGTYITEFVILKMWYC